MQEAVELRDNQSSLLVRFRGWLERLGTDGTFTNWLIHPSERSAKQVVMYREIPVESIKKAVIGDKIIITTLVRDGADRLTPLSGARVEAELVYGKEADVEPVRIDEILIAQDEV